MNKKRVERALKKYNIDNKYHTDVKRLENNVKRYLKAIEQKRMICSIDSVSKSGMSRTIKFVELNKGNLLNFYFLFKFLGFNNVRNSDYFRINGTGMDMVFNTNYTIINDLEYYGFITSKTARKLEQKTPHIL